MCGICGIVQLDRRPIEAEELDRMTGSLAHRGPDGDRRWTSSEGGVGLGHRRLAIIDVTPAGAQPMHYAGRFTITYNGEIYNYLELRDDLRRAGHAFRTASDTEVILAAYAEHGPRCVELFDGMFAFALWDRQEGRLFCARDRFGEKPFFFSHRPGRHFVFASEMKALFAWGVPCGPDPRMLFQYLAYGVVQDPFRPADTFYAGVQSLEPAHTLTLEAGNGSLRIERYWQLGPRPSSATPPFGEAAERLRGLLTRSITLRLRSDVPVGSSLSGGIDSAAIVCLLKAAGGLAAGAQRTFSARFHDASLDEGEYIDHVVARSGVSPHHTWPDAAGLSAHLEDLFHHQEEPFGTASPYAQWEVMRLARQHGTIVLLDGQGADEILAGYLHFFRPYLLGVCRRSRATFREERRAFESLHGVRFAADWRFRLEGLSPGLVRSFGRARRKLALPSLLPWLHPDFVRQHGTDQAPFELFEDLDHALRFFTQRYGLRSLLRYADRSSMAFGREVRLPFLSHELVEFVFSLPDGYKIQGGWTKRLLREAVRGIVPEPVRMRVRKLGYEPPQAAWMRSSPMIEKVAQERSRLAQEGILAKADATPGKDWPILMAGLLLSVLPARTRRAAMLAAER